MPTFLQELGRRTCDAHGVKSHDCSSGCQSFYGFEAVPGVWELCPPTAPRSNAPSQHPACAWSHLGLPRLPSLSLCYLRYPLPSPSSFGCPPSESSLRKGGRSPSRSIAGGTTRCGGGSAFSGRQVKGGGVALSFTPAVKKLTLQTHSSSGRLWEPCELQEVGHRAACEVGHPRPRGMGIRM